MSDRERRADERDDIRLDMVLVSRKVAAVQEQMIEHQVELAGLVIRARSLGVSWAKLGEWLGTSRQAAWERYAPAGERSGRLRPGG